MCSVVVRQEAFPHANVPAALLFEQHLLSPDSQAFIHNFRDPSFNGPLWFPRAVDNIGHSIYPPYPGEDPATELFTHNLAAYVTSFSRVFTHTTGCMLGEFG